MSHLPNLAPQPRRWLDLAEGMGRVEALGRGGERLRKSGGDGGCQCQRSDGRGGNDGRRCPRSTTSGGVSWRHHTASGNRGGGGQSHWQAGIKAGINDWALTRQKSSPLL
uniref:Uncharacterized protein n=1 Tax=Oryza glumipatula TaxID=40148 RepID=A0A0E0BSV1_9ORYZ